MTDRPYTDADLRAEAARQHATLTEDPDFMGVDHVGEQMEWAPIPSRPDDHWDDLDDADFDTAQRKIENLINDAADTSAWAINLGADGLEPDGHELGFSAGEQPIVRVHFAFHPDLSAEARDALVRGIREAAAGVMHAAAAGDDTRGGAL